MKSGTTFCTTDTIPLAKTNEKGVWKSIKTRHTENWETTRRKMDHFTRSNCSAKRPISQNILKIRKTKQKLSKKRTT